MQTPYLPFRIRVGVTGHRSALPDKIFLFEALHGILKMDQFKVGSHDSSCNMINLFDDKSRNEIWKIKVTPVAYEVVSSLAEGADRIVAQAVLETQNGLLTAVLPFSEDSYKSDFESATSAKEFHSLLDQAFYKYVMDQEVAPTGTNHFTAPKLSEKRIKNYRKAGHFVVNNCDVLIAIVDLERKAKSDAGTHAIVDFAVKAGRPVIKIIVNSEQVIKVETIKGVGLNASSLNQIEHYNDFLGRCNKKAYPSAVYDELFMKNGKPMDFISLQIKELIRDKVIPHYVNASRIAKRHKSWYQRSGLLAYVFAFLAVVVVVFGLMIKPFYHWSYFIEVVLLGSVLALITHANKKRAHKNWVESRFLVERIRSFFFFAINGCDIPRLSISPYMGEPVTHNGWMIRCFDEILINTGKSFEHTITDIKTFATYTNELWVQNQINYHWNKARNNRLKSVRIELAGKIIFAIAILSAATHFIFGIFHIAEKEEMILTMLSLILPPAAATLEGIRHHREYSRNAKRSNGMFIALQGLKSAFESVTDAGDYHQLILNVNDLTFRETQEWLMLMSTKKLEVVA